MSGGAPAGLRAQVVSLLCWGMLAVNSAFWATAALLAQPFFGFMTWHHVLRWWSRMNLRLGFFRVDSSGLDHLGGPAVIIANHRSVFDIVVLAALVPPPLYFVARHDLVDAPVIGMVLRRGRHILVRPDGNHEKPPVEVAIDRLRAGGTVVFFGEGKRSCAPRLLPLRSGGFHAARQAGCHVVPLALAGTEQAIPLHSRRIQPCDISVRALDPEMAPADEPELVAARDRFRALLQAAFDDMTGAGGPSERLAPVTITDGINSDEPPAPVPTSSPLPR